MTRYSLPHCDFNPPIYDGPSKESVISTRQEFCNPAIFHLYKEPFMVTNGYMQYLFDETGERYLDLFAGIVTVSCGHSHPRIIEKTKAQIDRIQHTTTIYLNPAFGELAKKLASKMPGDLGVTYFTNSGSEANDLALTMARLYTGNFDIIALENAYHGGISSTMGLTSQHTWKYPLPQGHGVHHAMCPDPYRHPFSDRSEAEIVSESLSNLDRVIQYQTPGQIAAFIAEPIQGVGGAAMAPQGYLKHAYEIARDHGGLCISDEVQTGFGRTGDHYWGFQNHGVTPDIVVMAKGIGNGVPLGAVTTTPEIANVLAQRLHFNTYGGNPVSMTQGLAVLETIDEDGLQKNSKVVGEYFKNSLFSLQEKHKIIGDVRGKGLMLGVELVKNRQSKEPAKEATIEFIEQCKNKNVLIGKGGLYGNVLRIKPPMCITKDDVNFAIQVMDDVFEIL